MKKITGKRTQSCFDITSNTSNLSGSGIILWVVELPNELRHGIPIIEPRLEEDTTCWHFTCKRKATTHDTSIICRVMIYVPVCSYHKARPSKGKVGFFTTKEVKYLKWFERIIRYLGREKNEHQGLLRRIRRRCNIRN